ncbi:MAG: hypothetical protein KDD62_10895 [Bdellovibrionales bacterium]|nr:hypothetical protein [Bdellovibrionales bacterium]
MKEELRTISFPTAMLGLFIAPADTMSALIQGGVARKGILFLFFFFVILFGPFVTWYLISGKFMYKPEVVLCLTLFVLLTLFVFVFCEKALLWLLAVKIPIVTLTHIACYCLSSLMLSVLLIYGLNYWASGGESIEYLTFFPQGFARMGEKQAGYLPMLLNLGSVYMGIQFCAGLRVAGNLLWTSAFFITILSLIPFLSGVVLSLLLAEQVYPGFIELMRTTYSMPSSIVQF